MSCVLIHDDPLHDIHIHQIHTCVWGYIPLSRRISHKVTYNYLTRRLQLLATQLPNQQCTNASKDYTSMCESHFRNVVIVNCNTGSMKPDTILFQVKAPGTSALSPLQPSTCAEIQQELLQPNHVLPWDDLTSKSRCGKSGTDRKRNTRRVCRRVLRWVFESQKCPNRFILLL